MALPILVGVMAVLAALAVAFRHTAGVAALLLLLMPVLRDGPLNVADLWGMKVAAVAVALVIATLRTREHLGTPLHRRMTFLIIIGALLTVMSLAMSDRPDVGANSVKASLAASLMFLLVTRVFGRQFLRAGIAAIVCGVLAACVVSFMQWLALRYRLYPDLLRQLLPLESRIYNIDLQHGLDHHGVRLQSFFFHSNEFSHFLSIAFGFLLPLVLHTSRSRIRTIYFTTIVCILLSCVLTQSRGSLAIVGAEVLVVLAATRSRLLTLRRCLIGLGLVIAVGGLAVRSNLGALARRTRSFTLSHREEIWHRAAQLVPRNVLFGVGSGCASYEMLRSFAPVDYEVVFTDYHSRVQYNLWNSNPHNYFLKLLVETGVFCLLVRVALLVLAIGYGIRSVVRSRRESLRVLALAATVPLCGELVRSFFEAYNFLDAPENGCHFAFFLGIIVFVSSKADRVPRACPAGVVAPR